MFKPMPGGREPAPKRKGPMPPSPAGLDIVVGVGKPGGKEPEPPAKEPPVKEPEVPLEGSEVPPEVPPEGTGAESIEDLGEKYGMRPEDVEGFVADLFDLMRRKIAPVEQVPIAEGMK